MTKKTQEQLYLELLQAIVNKQKEILGPKVAIERAQKVEDFWVNSEGLILQVKRDHKSVLQSLINEYFKLTTRAGLESCVEVIRDHLQKNDHLDLPEEIKLLLKDK